MTVDLLDEEPAEDEEFVIAALTGLYPAAIKKRTEDPVPFCIVRHIAGDEDPGQGHTDPVVSVRVVAPTEAECLAASKDVHRRMLYLSRYPMTDVIVGGQVRNADWVRTFQPFEWVRYDNESLFCRKARYQLGLPFVTVE